MSRSKMRTGERKIQEGADALTIYGGINPMEPIVMHASSNGRRQGARSARLYWIWCWGRATGAILAAKADLEACAVPGGGHTGAEDMAAWQSCAWITMDGLAD
jgi:hypothetical protein